MVDLKYILSIMCSMSNSEAREHRDDDKQHPQEPSDMQKLYDAAVEGNNAMADGDRKKARLALHRVTWLTEKMKDVDRNTESKQEEVT